MNAVIQINYITIRYKSRAYQKGEFRLRGRKPEVVAFEFWKKIREEMPAEIKLERVLCEGEDLTDLIMQLEKNEDHDLGLPF